MTKNTGERIICERLGERERKEVEEKTQKGKNGSYNKLPFTVPL